METFPGAQPRRNTRVVVEADLRSAPTATRHTEECRRIIARIGPSSNPVKKRNKRLPVNADIDQMLRHLIDIHVPRKCRAFAGISIAPSCRAEYG
jgi:hypothetical protein